MVPDKRHCFIGRALSEVARGCGRRGPYGDLVKEKGVQSCFEVVRQSMIEDMGRGIVLSEASLQAEDKREEQEVSCFVQEDTEAVGVSKPPKTVVMSTVASCRDGEQ